MSDKTQPFREMKTKEAKSLKVGVYNADSGGTMSKHKTMITARGCLFTNAFIYQSFQGYILIENSTE